MNSTFSSSSSSSFFLIVLNITLKRHPPHCQHHFTLDIVSFIIFTMFHYRLVSLTFLIDICRVHYFQKTFQRCVYVSLLAGVITFDISHVHNFHSSLETFQPCFYVPLSTGQSRPIAGNSNEAVCFAHEGTLNTNKSDLMINMPSQCMR